MASIKLFYQQEDRKTSWWKTYNKSGGICDMTLLYYFIHGATEFKGLRLPGFPQITQDLTHIIDDELVFDLHMEAPGNHPYPDDWEMTKEDGFNIKKITFQNGMPYCYNKRLGKSIRFALLHFAGGKKALIPRYLT